MSTRSARSILSVSRAALSSMRPTLRPIAARQSPAAITAASSRTFIASASRLGGGETDAGLSAKLAEELTYEKDAQSALAGRDPEWLEAFHHRGIWKITDKPAIGEVVLERNFSNEKLKLTFSIEDLDNPPDTSDLAQSSDSAETPEEPESTFPIRCSLSISKPNGGSLVLDLLVENDAFVIDSAQFYADNKVAEDLTAEGDWKRRATYVGPRFDHLDSSVQTEFENFLDERDINAELAAFIPSYCEYEEQKEYMSWLEKVKRFIDL